LERVSLIASFASKYSSAMAGDANNAGAPRICKPIISGLVAVLEGMWKKISLPLQRKPLAGPHLNPQVLRVWDEAKDDMSTAN
jgi:hypothetical protein